MVGAAVLAVTLLSSEEAAPAAEDSTPPAPEDRGLRGSLLVVAHRGRLHGLPENSLEGVAAALRGPHVDAVEVDVRADGEGRLRLAHDEPVPEEAPTYSAALRLLEDPAVPPSRFLILDVKGDAALASRFHAATPEALLSRVVFMVRTLDEAALFRAATPEARLWVNLPYDGQGTPIPGLLGAEAVVLNAGFATGTDFGVHWNNGTPVVVHAINSLSRAKALRLHAVIVAVGPEGTVTEHLGAYYNK